MILIYSTFANTKEARKVSELLLKKKLIACATVIPSESSYLWNGTIKHEKEVICIMKTVKEKWLAAKKEIEKNHPYDIPCILKIDAEANQAYELWMKKET